MSTSTLHRLGQPQDAAAASMARELSVVIIAARFNDGIVNPLIDGALAAWRLPVRWGSGFEVNDLAGWIWVRSLSCRQR